MTDAVQYAKSLVEVPSVSVNSNIAVSDVVESHLRELGFQLERIEYNDRSGVTKANVIGKLGAGTGGLAYFSHTDVVPADTWSIQEHGPFQPTVRDERLYGRGSCDMKGSIATMLAAVSRIDAKKLSEPVYVICTADEEVGSNGAREVVNRSAFYREIVDAQTHSIIGEPTELDVVYAHKGIYGFRATAHGIAAHSSTRAGVNANLAMIPFLVEMKAIHDETLTDPAWLNNEFDPPWISWNIGINDQTRAVNITAPQSVCTVYFRPMPGQDGDALVRQAEEVAKRCGLDFDWECRGQAMYGDPDSEFVRESLRISNRPKALTVSYGTDGVCFNELRNVIVLGPGSIKQAHTADEWISLDQLARGTDVYERHLQRWCMQQR